MDKKKGKWSHFCPVRADQGKCAACYLDWSAYLSHCPGQPSLPRQGTNTEVNTFTVINSIFKLISVLLCHVSNLSFLIVVFSFLPLL